MEEYASKEERISVIHNEVNQKLPRSLNIGFLKARGEYLTWTSDDNRYLPDALKTMVGYLEGHSEAVAVRSDYFFIDAEGELTGRSVGYSDHAMYAYNCFGACFLYKKEVMESVGEYNADAFGVEDYDYWLRILDKVGRIDTIHECLYEYRRHGESLSEKKRQMVLSELAKLRERHKEKILDELKNDKAELCRIYYEMMPIEAFGAEIRIDFQRACPVLKGDLGFTGRKPFIIFGAGIYGERAAKILGEKAVYFTDNDLSKAGKMKCGKEIIPFDRAKTLSDQYDFFIAVNNTYIYELIQQLEEAGISEYSVMQSYVAGMENIKIK